MVKFAFTPALTPVNVKPFVAVSVTDAVYCVLARNTEGLELHDTDDAVKPVPGAGAVVTGELPVAGAVTVIAAVVIGATGVTCNILDAVPAPALFLARSVMLYVMPLTRGLLPAAEVSVITREKPLPGKVFQVEPSVEYS